MPATPSISPKMSSTTGPIPVTAQVGQTGQATQTQTSQGSKGFDIFGSLSKGLGLGGQVMSMFNGAGFGGMAQGGQLGSRLPDLSELPSVQAFKNFDFRGNMSQLDPALQEAINRDFDRIDAQEDHDFRNRWKNVRPGADIENDSVFARDYKALKDSQAMRRADAMSKYRMEMIQTNLGVNQMEAERLQQLAQLDIDTISFNTGLDAQEAMQLKQMFGYGTSQESGMSNTLSQVGNIAGQVGDIMGTFNNG